MVQTKSTQLNQGAAVEIKDIALPDNMQRATAKQAETERERRAKIVAAQGNTRPR
jgi:regulator of protease activity HflC (stomatin/prohibitin superfamily)